MISPFTVGRLGKLPTSVTGCIVRRNHGGLGNLAALEISLQWRFLCHAIQGNTLRWLCVRLTLIVDCINCDSRRVMFMSFGGGDVTHGATRRKHLYIAA